MMDDRELLELAAKSINGEFHSGHLSVDGGIEWEEWNPLADDGDALRIAVKLGLDIEFLNGDTLVLNVAEGGGDPCERTRRAIVRAAAEIGKHSAPSKEES